MATVTVVDTPNQTIVVPNQAVFSLGGNTTLTAKTVTSAYTMAAVDTLLFVDPTANSFTLTLPSAVGFNSVLHVVCTTLGTNVVTLTPTGSQKINGATTQTLGNVASTTAVWHGGISLVSDGINWWVDEAFFTGGGGGSGYSTPLVVQTPFSGATTSVRFVGGTTGGAPTSGTFQVGDYIIATNGAIWVCTTAGTPGSWTNPSGGTSSGKAKITPLAQNLPYTAKTTAGSGGAVVWGNTPYTATGGQCYAWISGTASTVINSGITLSLYLEVDSVVSTANATSFTFASGSAGLKGTFPHTILSLGTLSAATHQFRIRTAQSLITNVDDYLNVGIMEV